jgi:hypothetical protein
MLQPKSYLAVLLAGASLALSACSLLVPPRQEETQPVEEPAVEPVADDTAAQLHSHEDYAELQASYRELEDRATRAELLLLERDARIRELEQRLDRQQRLIDETISEVVRAKAKLRSVESRAEAASQMAEAEIALKGLGELAGGERTPEYVQAAELLERSGREFEEENYGGAMYLTNQAKTIISLAQLRIRNRERIETSAGEVAFSVPLSLEVARRSNVRKGPGLQFPVLTVLEAGAPVTGYSYKGKWVQVKLEDGSRGWIYQTLLSGR